MPELTRRLHTRVSDERRKRPPAHLQHPSTVSVSIKTDRISWHGCTEDVLGRKQGSPVTPSIKGPIQDGSSQRTNRYPGSRRCASITSSLAGCFARRPNRFADRRGPDHKLSVEMKGVESVRREDVVLNGLRSDREAALVCTYAWSERACVSMGAGKESRELVGRAWRRSLHAYLLAVRRLRQGRRHLGSRRAALLSKESFLGDGHPVSGSWVASRRAAWSIGVRHGCNREGDAVLRRKGAGNGEKASPSVVSESAVWAVGSECGDEDEESGELHEQCADTTMWVDHQQQHLTAQLSMTG